MRRGEEKKERIREGEREGQTERNGKEMREREREGEQKR